MSKNTKVAIGMIVCAAILLAALALSLSGVVKSIISGGLSFGGITYSDVEKYTAGEAVIQDQVKNLDIHWINGQVNVAYHKENTIELKETSNKDITPDLQLRWWVDGDTLRVQYAKSGFRTGSLNNQVKQLTITLPEGAFFGNVSIDATSADLKVPSLKADSLSVDVTSGNINVSGEITNLTAGATSGDMVLELTAQAKSIHTDTTSGNVQIAAPGAEEIRTSSTSGDVKISELGEYARTFFAGMHLNDVVDFNDDHFAPGDGKVDFAALKDFATNVRHVVFEPSHAVSEESLRRSVAHIRSLWCK